MVSEYFFILVVAVVAFVIVTALLVLSAFLGPKRPGAEKEMPYECGMVPNEEAKGR